MTITTRSKRVSLFDSTPTPSTVGPGAYGHGTSFKSESKPLYSGFAASDQRNLNANKTTSAMTPGPGAYISTAQSNSQPVAVSNAFATKISRFAPSAPGSTIYRPSSIQDNPGPGAYTTHPQPAVVRPKSSPKHYNMVTNQSTVDAFTTWPSVPTIPTRAQSFGYTKDPVNGELKAQAQPSSIYTGIGQDTVGPAAYSSHAAIYNDRKNVASSIKSTVNREVWEEYSTPRRAVPGPGQYDPKRAGATSGGGGGASDKKRQSAVFASRVPILPEPRRADQYDEERDLELLAKDQRNDHYLQQHRHLKTNGIAGKVEAFGSTTKRTDIASQISAPFSSPTFKNTPGPGKYGGHTRSNFSTFGGGTTTFHSKATRGIVYRDDQHIGFTSATERYCMSQAKPSSLPGPGTYKAETPRTMEKSVKSKQTVGRFGVFGSNSERHVWERLHATEPEDITPGPGAYEAATATASGAGQGGHFPMVVSSAAFKSSSSRFAKRANPHASPHIHCVGDTTSPAVGHYNLMAAGSGSGSGSGDYHNEDRDPLQQSRPLSSPRAPFLSTSERSVFDPKEAQYVPGPGQYASQDDHETAHGMLKPQVLTRSHGVRATLNNEERFRVKERVADHVGPGAYAIAGTVGTKSFNVTMAAATTATAKRR